MDIGKIDPKKAQEIINALKDGKIDLEKEARQLGLTAKEAEELNKAFSSGEVRIGDFILVNKGKTPDGKKQITETREAESSLFGSVKDFFKGRYEKLVKPFVEAWNNNNGAADVAKAEVKAAGEVAMNAAEILIEQQVNTLKGAVSFAVAPVACTPEPTDINQTGNQEVFITHVNENSTHRDAIVGLKEEMQGMRDDIKELHTTVKAILQREIANGTKVDDLIALVKSYGVDMKTIINLLTEGNSFLVDIKNSNQEIIDKGGADAEKILRAIYEVKASVDGIGKQIETLPADMKAEFKADLEAIYNAIKDGNNTLNNIQFELQSLATKLLAKLNDIYKQAKTNGKTQVEIRDLLDKIANGKGKDYTEILMNMLDVLKNIDFTTQETNETVKTIAEEIKDMKKQLGVLVTNSTEINSRVTNIAKTEEQQKALLEQILAAIKAVGATNSAENQAILEALLKQGNKLGDIMAILRTINSNVDAGNKANKEYGDLILAAIKAGNADLSELVKLTKHIDEDQHKIIGNQDVTIGIGNAILEWLQNYKPTPGPGVDYTKYLDKIYAKLDEILGAIKDHEVHVTVDDINVTVDVTGKVKCECTCSDGHKHEGILGDLGIN